VHLLPAVDALADAAQPLRRLECGLDTDDLDSKLFALPGSELRGLGRLTQLEHLAISGAHALKSWECSRADVRRQRDSFLAAAAQLNSGLSPLTRLTSLSLGLLFTQPPPAAPAAGPHDVPAEHLTWMHALGGQLVELQLLQCFNAAGAIAAVSAAMPHLTRLRLGEVQKDDAAVQNMLAEVTPQQLSPLSALSKLRWLRLDCCLGPRQLEALSLACSQLTSLGIGTPTGGLPATCTACWPQLLELRVGLFNAQVPGWVPSDVWGSGVFAAMAPQLTSLQLVRDQPLWAYEEDLMAEIQFRILYVVDLRCVAGHPALTSLAIDVPSMLEACDGGSALFEVDKLAQENADEYDPELLDDVRADAEAVLELAMAWHLVPLLTLKGLRSLALSGMTGTSEEFSAFYCQHLALLTQLTHLRVSGSDLGVTLTCVTAIRSLRWLEMERGHPTWLRGGGGDPGACLACAASLSQLERVSFTRIHGVTEAGLTRLAAVVPSLRRVDVVTREPASLAFEACCVRLMQQHPLLTIHIG
jgi:hypothetical protein